MENYENNEFRPEPEQTEPQPQMPPVGQPYSGAGVGRKESPFADSPYEMNRRPNPNDYRCGSTYVPPIPPQYPPEKPKKERHANSGKGWKKILCAVLALAVIAGSCGITAALVNNRWENRMDRFEDSVEVRLNQMQAKVDAAKAAADIANGNSNSGTVSLGDALTPGQVYAKNVQSVVLITCEVQSSTFGQIINGESFGSGFILTENGYVVTNAHVVEGASSIKVSTHSGEDLKAKLVGTDTTNDVAVLKVEAENLPAVTVG